MKILIAQISDMHMKPQDNAVTPRAKRVASAIREADPLADACFLAVTGDVVDRGQLEGYERANEFITEVRNALLQIRDDYRVHEVYIPGNHDCTHDEDDDVRDSVIERILKKVEAPYRPSNKMVETCAAVQDGFFAFRAKRLGEEKPLVGAERLFFRHQYVVKNKHVYFHCYNTSWMSTTHERAHELLVPVGMTPDDSGPDGVVVSLLHHPLGWLNNYNHRSFRKELEESSDIIMTGHEHEEDYYTKKVGEGPILNYVEAPALQGNAPHESGFNVITLDVDRKRYAVKQFKWDKDYYRLANNGEAQPFERGKVMSRHGLDITDEYMRKMNEVGTGFSPPTERDITLDDLFVYPSFDQEASTKKSSKELSAGPIPSQKAVEYINSHKHILIMGADKSGKTSLAKSLYKDLARDGMLPLMVQGSALRKFHNQEGMARVITEAAAEQYGPDLAQRYTDSDKDKKVLIVDDFQQAVLPLNQENTFADIALATFSKVIVIASDTYQFNELVRKANTKSVILGFKILKIREFGYVLRGALIKRWFDLSNDLATDDLQVIHRRDEAERLVSSLLGKNTLPAYPIFVLTILQQYEAASGGDTAAGSLAYYYEYLINTELSKRAVNISADALYAYISLIAYRMFEKKTRALSEADLAEISKEYKSEYDVPFQDDEMKKILEDARMVYKDADFNYRFKYKYVYYYFVARYIQRNLNLSPRLEQQLWDDIDRMVKKVYVESYANILIFLVYLTNHSRIIEGIVTNAQKLYNNHLPCDLTSDVKFLKEIATKPIRYELTEGNVEDRKLSFRENLDEVNQRVAARVSEESDDEDDSEDTGQIEAILNLNICNKTLQIMGQILRNSPGSLPAETKLLIARESYLLGLRALQAIYTQIADNVGDIKTFLSWILQDQEDLVVSTDADRRELERKTDLFLVLTMTRIAHGFIKRISFAVGSEYLKETYKRIEEPRSPIAIELINTSIEMDHYKNFPASNVIRINERLGRNSNLFAQNILQRMVRDHFYLFYSNRNVMQRVCDKLKIKVNVVPALGPAQKKQE